MLFKAYTKPIDEMLSYCKVIRGLQNIFKLLTNDSILNIWFMLDKMQFPQ